MALIAPTRLHFLPYLKSQTEFLSGLPDKIVFHGSLRIFSTGKLSRFSPCLPPKHSPGEDFGHIVLGLVNPHLIG